MAYFTSLWQARIIENHRLEYENEKFSSLLISNTEIPRKTIMQRWRIYGHHTRRRMTGRLKKWFPEGSSVSNLYYYLKTDQTFPNFVLKSIIGFLGGIVLTYLCFMFFVFQLSISLMHATIMSSIIGVLLTLGLAFSYRIRCLVFLLIPQFFSRVGRYTLTCYALVLILTGPATNTLRNLEVLTESMACSQEQIKSSVREISESMKTPFNSMKGSIKFMVDKIKRVTARLNGLVSKIGVLVTSIGDEIQSSLNWLSQVVNVCNNKFGTPYNHCMEAMNKGLLHCKKYLGRDLAWMCNTSLVKSACLSLKSYDPICVVADYATTSFAATLRRRLKIFTARIEEAFFIDIETHHPHSFINTTSATANQVAAGIVTEIRNRADPLLTWLSWSSCVTSLFLLLIIFRAKYYQQMYETRSRFDNRYVTKELRELDFKRYMEGRETVLPLNRRERAKYISIMSYRLIATEKVYLTRSIVFMAITTFKLLIHMVADYSLFWILMNIRYHGRFQSQISPGPSDGGVHISGTGFVSDFIRSLFDAMTSPLSSHVLSPVTCLPNPHPPDLKRYMQIGVLILLLWFFSLLEPYGLRLRHVIMGHYRPERAKARAVWLYNHILRTRGSFMKLARRKLHREYKYAFHEDMTFRHVINSYIPWWCLKYVFRKLPNSQHCLLCNTLEDLKDVDTKLISCETFRCPGVYCVSCFSDIGKLCTICLSPTDYGDISDASLENGSSDDSSDGDNDNLKLNRSDNNERTALIRKAKTNHRNDNNNSNKAGGQHEANNFSSDESYTKYLESTLNYYCQYTNDNEKCRDDFIWKINWNDFTKNKSFKTLANKKGISRNQKQKYRSKLHQHCRKLRLKNVKQTIFYRLLLNISKFLRTNGSKFCSNKYDIRRSTRYIKINKKPHARTKLIAKDWKNIQRSNQRIYKNVSRRPDLKILFIKRIKPSNTQNSSLLVNSSYTIDFSEHPQDKDGINKKNRHKKKKYKVPKNGKSSPGKKKRCQGVKRMCKICSSCFTSIKRGLTPSKHILHNLKNNNYPYSSDKSNYKRRKKGTRHDNEKKYIANESVNTRHYRLSSYLLENCWIRNNDKYPKNNRIQMGQALDEKHNEDIFKVNKKVNLMKSAKCLGPFHDRTCTRNTEKSTAKNPLSTFRKRVNCNNAHQSRSISNDDQRNTDDLSPKKKLSSSHADPNIARRMNYYRSIGISDFEEPIVNSKTDEVSRQNKLSAETMRHPRTDNSHTSNCSKIKFEFDRLSTSLKSFKIKEVKLGISERFLHLRIRNPLPVLRDLYITLLEASKKDKRETHPKMSAVEKGVLVVPAVESQSCQCDNKMANTTNFEHRTTQIYRKDKNNLIKRPTAPKLVSDVAVEVIKATCTCATQYEHFNEDNRCNCIQNNVTQECHCELGINTNFGDTTESQITESTESLSLSDDTKTDTTICSRVAINYEESPGVRNRTKRRVRVVTKANRSTTTERAILCDVSTITNDWWSPIEERKLGKQSMFKETGQIKRQCKKHKGISTDGRIVTFMSQAQIIPSDAEDILSPSRYLLESQRYYNELFSSKIYSPRVFPAIFLKAKDCGKSVASKDSMSTIRKGNRKRNGKPKRLDKRVSPTIKTKIGRTRSDESSFQN